MRSKALSYRNSLSGTYTQSPAGGGVVSKMRLVPQGPVVVGRDSGQRGRYSVLVSNPFVGAPTVKISHCYSLPPPSGALRLCLSLSPSFWVLSDPSTQPTPTSPPSCP